jgi:hypothetical protein
MKKYYWLIAGVLVGVFTVVMAYVNLKLILPSGTIDAFSYLGMILVVIEYAAIIYLLSFGQRFFKK